MTVAAKILADGKVRLAASGRSIALLDSLPYLRKRDRLWETRWTYAPDLRRDVPSISFRSGSAEALRSLLDRVEHAREGDDAEVLSWFRRALPPRGYQIEAIHAGLNLERLCIADQVGIGKTIEGLGIMLGLFARGRIRRAIVLAPKSCGVQWLREVHEKASPRVLPKDVRLLAGTPARRARILRGDWNVLILSPEVFRIDLPALARYLPTVGLVILDEASCIRNENATTAAIVAGTRRIRYKVALTATPIENGLSDLYSILQWVDPRTFLSKSYFDRRYVIWRVQRYKVFSKKFGKAIKRTSVVPAKYRRLDEVRAKIRPSFLRRTAEEVGEELPEVVVSRELLELGTQQRAVYELVAARTKEKIEAEDLAGGAALAPLQSLRGACDSTELVEEGRRGGRRGAVKTDRLRELLDGEFRGEAVIVFTDFAEYVKLLARDLRAFKPEILTGALSARERQVSVDRFTRGYSRLLLMTSAGQRGLNLQVSGIVVLADVPWNPAAIKQRIGRARRIGSKHGTLRVRLLVAEDTVESRLILPKIDLKQKLSLDVVGADELTVDPLAGMSARAIAKLL